jgi:arabinose-5-phosphate isomerase
MRVAVCLMEIRDFKPEDFAIYHPGGALGKITFACTRYRTHVKTDGNLTIKSFFEIRKKIRCHSSSAKRKKIGIITDGDIRRTTIEKLC